MTKQQIARAKGVELLDYLLACEPDNLKQQGPNRYILRDHDSFVLTGGKWYWNSRHTGCKSATALNYLTTVRGMGFVEAVRLLAGDAAISISKQPRPPPGPKAPFRLPPRNRDNLRVTAYLQSRGIRKDVIEECIKAGILYESANTHYCVFTGKTAEGKTRFACYRSTSGRYRQDEIGSDKRYGFLLQPQNQNSKGIALFEAPVDALSHKTLYTDGYTTWDGWRLALGGGSPAALLYFLEHHPKVTECLVCTDNDKAGELVAEKIATLPKEDERFAHLCVSRALPPYGTDFNEALQIIRRMEHKSTTTHHRAENSR